MSKTHGQKMIAAHPKWFVSQHAATKKIDLLIRRCMAQAWDCGKSKWRRVPLADNPYRYRGKNILTNTLSESTAVRWVHQGRLKSRYCRAFAKEINRVIRRYMAAAWEYGHDCGRSQYQLRKYGTYWPAGGYNPNVSRTYHNPYKNY